METKDGPFRVPDLWRKSAFSLADAPEQTLFGDIQPELSLISHDFTKELQLPDLETFQFGRLEDINQPEVSNPEGSVSNEAPSEPDQDDDDDDVWHLDVTVPKGGELRTWEAFTDDKHSQARIAYISEAGPRAFDALQDDSSNVVQTAFFLKCLAMLGLGRSSALFQWDSKNTQFVPALDKVRLSGFSLVSSTSLVKQLSQTGSQFAELRNFVDQAYAAKSPLAARVALATCIQVVLDALDQNLAEHVLTAPTALRLLSHFDMPGQILAEMLALIHATSRADTDVVFLSQIRIKIEHLGHACSPFHKVHLDILDCVGRPWLHRLCRKTGLLHEKFDLSADTGIVQDIPFDHPGLMLPEDIETITEITTGLAILKDASPHHPLLLPTSWGIEQLDLNLSSTQIHADRILDQAKQYQSRLLDAISSYDQGLPKPRYDTVQQEPHHVTSEQMPWQHDENQQEYFELVGSQFTQPPLNASVDFSSDLRATVSAMTTANTAHEDTLDLDTNNTTPLQHLQPYLHAQSCLVNGSILRLLFHRLDIRKHLNLQYSFHLFGNGIFVHRLTNALFSSESHSAERQRGQVIGGVNLGLRLDSRETRKWPPASSELRLGLMGVLTDAWASPGDLPGGLSFSIRELDDSEIEKVLDPHGINALDFLRLRYEAPAPLDVVLTPDAMDKYDDVFRILLRVLRMVHVVTLLRRSATTTHSKPAMQAFAHEAHHTVTALSSYMFDSGITIPWHRFNSRLDTLETDLGLEDATPDAGYGSRVRIGVQGLCILHDEMLDTMRARLLLRTRHSKLRYAVNEILETILEVQKMIVESREILSESELWDGRDRLRKQVKDLLRQLMDLGRKLAKRGPEMEGQDREDAIAAEMLRFKLDPAAVSGMTRV